MSRSRTALLYSTTAFLSLTYASSSIFKFSDLHHFDRYGYPLWFCLAIGVLEAAGAVGLWVPRLAAYVAFLLAAEMAGAVVTHLRIGERAHALFPISLFFVLIVVGAARYNDSRHLGRDSDSVGSARSLRA